MSKINFDKIVEELKTESNFPAIIDLVNDNPSYKLSDRTLYELARLLNRCKFVRQVPTVNFVIQPEVVLDWYSWNSGGGCMIWSLEYTHSDGNTHSIHVTDECMNHSNVTGSAYWDMEDWDDQESTHLSESYYFDKPPMSIATYLCAYTGQELADIIEEDIRKIHANW